MSNLALKELIHERANILPLHVKQYHAMIANGILPEGEPYELLDGYLVRKDRSATGEDPMTVGHDHAWVVKTLAILTRKLEPLGCHLQTQQPVSIPPHQEPEPDGAIVLGSEDDFRERHPGAKDVLCVIEVADASLSHDRTVKGRIYSSGGIAQYVIVNLPGGVIEVYAQPNRRQGRYREKSILKRGDQIVFPAAKGKSLKVPVSSLLPRPA